MIYLVYGHQNATIKNRIRKIVRKSLPETDDMNYVVFDGSNVTIQECLEEVRFLPLGYDHKAVVVDNCYFLLKPKPRNKIDSDQDFSELEKYIRNPNPDTDLILAVCTSDAEIDKRSKILNLIQGNKESCLIQEILDPDVTQWKSYVEKYFRESLNTEIDNDAVNEVIARTGQDVALFQNSAKKLALYTNHVTYDDVCLMVMKPLEDNVFLIFNYLMSGDNGSAVSLFRDLGNSTEPITIVGLLANQFRLLNEVAFLYKKGYNEETIAGELGIKTGRVFVLRKYVKLLTARRLQEILDDLYQLDVQIKSGLVDRFYAFELFLISFRRF